MAEPYVLNSASGVEKELLRLTQRLLDAIAQRDWATYAELCDPNLSAFEPEARGHLVIGSEFHRFYFEAATAGQYGQSTMSSPYVRMLGPDAALVAYIRLARHLDAEGRPITTCYEETRLWERQPDGRWLHVHFHRSMNR